MYEDHSTEDDFDVNVLQPGTVLLHGQYCVESYLVRGGFGVTYLARDSLDRMVVIKECLPGAICCRVGGRVQAISEDQAQQYASILRHFLREARRLARLDHPNIVGVHQVFEENNTAYMALDYVEGVDLLTVLEDQPEKLHPERIREMVKTALNALVYIHDQDILHRDISPDNFLLSPDNTLTLIDFGAAREQAGKESRALSALLAVKDGYSPHEFYMRDVAQFPSSDLYSLGATLYHLITGYAPPNSQERLAALASDSPDPYVPLARTTPGYDPVFLSCIDKALAVLPRDRMQTASDWLSILSGEMAAPDMLDEPEEVQAAPDPGPDLTRVITRLVKDTNAELVPGQPGKKAARRVRHTTSRFRPIDYDAKNKRPSQPVDIFGNPIEDVETWLREQDGGVMPNLLKRRGRSKDPAPAPDTSKSEPASEQGEERKSLKSNLRKTLSKRLSPFRVTRGHAVQN